MGWVEYFLERRATPNFLKRPVSSKVTGAIALVGDLIAECLRRAIAASWVRNTNCPTDANDIIGRERGIWRRPNETNGAYGLRLQRAWDTWQTAGWRHQLEEEIQGLGYPGAFILATRDWDGVSYPAWSDSSELNNWSRFWVYIPHTGHSITADGNWDDPGTWSDGGVWDFANFTVTQALYLRALIDKFRPAHEIPVLVRFLLESGSFTDVDTWSGASLPLPLYS